MPGPCEREGLIDGTALPLLPGAEGSGTDPQWLLDRLAAADTGTYLVVGHPTYEDDDAAPIVGLGNERGDVATDRADRRQMFTDERVREYCEEHGIALLRYDEL